MYYKANLYQLLIKQMLKKIFIPAILLLSSTIVYGQRTFSGTPADSSATKKETQIIVNSTNANEYFGSSARAKRPEKPVKTSIKLNPLLVISGDMPVYVEHKLAEKLSAEVSLGVTYDNFLTDIFELEHYTEQIKKQNEMGYSYSAGLRFYPSNSYETMEGYYFAPEYRYRTYRSTATEYLSLPLDVPVKQERNISDFKLMFGYVDYIEDQIFIDTYVGVGFRKKDYYNMIKEGASVYNGQTIDPVYATWDDHKKAPLLSLGFKFGFSF